MNGKAEDMGVSLPGREYGRVGSPSSLVLSVPDQWRGGL